MASGIFASLARALADRLDRSGTWSQTRGAEDPERTETVYTMRTRDGGRIEVTWHDGNPHKWQWFYWPAGSEEPTNTCERLFPTPTEAKAHAERWAATL